jgi:hypothetical protein
MRSHATAYLSGLALLAAAGCAGSGRTDAAGAAPIDSIHIRSGDTLPPANPAARGAQHDTSATDSTRKSDTSSTP